MNEVSALLVALVLPVIGVAAGVYLRRKLRQKRGERKLAESSAHELEVPLTLHPVIDPDLCTGCYSCLDACPEGDILGIVKGQVALVSPSHCIGHGRCAAECPTSAIRLVFGSRERGIDLPEVNGLFESTRRGVFVVGELGGMGLIKNAMTQGLQVAQHLETLLSQPSPVPLEGVDVAIVGSGPAGIAAALGCRKAGLSFRVLEQDTVGGAVAHYPRQKLVMTESIELPFFGRFGKKNISKESLLGLWQKILRTAEVRVDEGTRVTEIKGRDGAFRVVSPQGELLARKVVLATGQRGTPIRLEVPGHDLPNIAYRLTDARQYDGRQVLVVGGGDSALEAAIALAEESDARVAISYRREGFMRSRAANREKIQSLIAQKQVRAFFSSEVRAVYEDRVKLRVKGKDYVLRNDFVIACLGGQLPTEFLNRCGVKLKSYFGTGPDSLSRSTRVEAGEIGQGRENRKHRRLVWGLTVLSALLLGGLWWKGRSYYLLPAARQLGSPLNASLRPAGPWGHGLGIAATAVMMSNFLYAARKRWGRIKGLGSIRSWMTFHVFVGFVSPLVIAFHAAFRSNNLLATSTASALGVVLVTGLIGRFIYGLVPMRDGTTLEQEEVNQQWERQKFRLERLATSVGHSDDLDALVEKTKTAQAAKTMLQSLVVQMPLEAVRGRARLWRLRRLFPTQQQYAEFVRVFLTLTRLKVQVGFYRGLKRFLAIWRVFHIGLSLFLVLLIAAHIGVSLYLGYGLNVFR